MCLSCYVTSVALQDSPAAPKRTGCPSFSTYSLQYVHTVIHASQVTIRRTVVLETVPLSYVLFGLIQAMNVLSSTCGPAEWKLSHCLLTPGLSCLSRPSPHSPQQKKNPGRHLIPLQYRTHRDLIATMSLALIWTQTQTCSQMIMSSSPTTVRSQVEGYRV